jgi:hypothetical protein
VSSHHILNVNSQLWFVSFMYSSVSMYPSAISAHSRPPLLASGAHSIGFRMVVCVYVVLKTSPVRLQRNADARVRAPKPEKDPVATYLDETA